MTNQEKLVILCQYLPFGVDGVSRYKTVFRLDIVNTMSGSGNESRTIDVWLSNEIRPILRPLSSMTEEEKDEMHERFDVCEIDCFDANGRWIICDKDGAGLPIPEQCRQWLLSKHFDLFGYLESGFAVEKV